MSPFSVHDDLTMAAVGARGQTFNEMHRALSLSGNRNSFSANYKTLLTPLYAAGSVLTVANGIYIQNDLTLQSAYSNLLSTDFFTTVKTLDFTQPAAAAATINSDVATATHDLIQDIIPAGALSADTKLVLVNAVYFKNTWLHKFKTTDTQLRPFHTAVGASGDITTMRLTVSSV